MGPTANQKTDSGSPTWKARLHAWWEGYELPAPAAASAPAVPQDDGAQGKSGRRLDAATSRALIDAALWGVGFGSPGGSDLLSMLCRPLGLDATTTTLLLGVERGGPVRALVESTGTYVEGYDTDPSAIAMASAYAAEASLGEKARFAPLDPDRPVLKPNRYGAVVSKDWLYRAANKRALLNAMWQALKPGGQLMVTDYVLLRTGPPGAATSAWYAAENAPIEPWLATRVATVLGELPLDVRISEDITAQVREGIGQAFGRLQKSIAALDLDSDGIRVLRDAAQLWTARQQALASGEVGVYRFVAQKPRPVQ